MGKMWIVYIVQCNDGTFYTGITKNIVRRLHEHNHSKNKGARYIRSRRPVCLVYSEVHVSKKDALVREIAIKKLSRKAKLSLILK